MRATLRPVVADIQGDGETSLHNRKAGRFVHVEVLPGVVTVVAAWMLGASACVGMEIGAPRVSVAALRDLDNLLKRRGQRRSCPGDIAAKKEQPDARPQDEAADAEATADAAGLDAAAGMSPPDRREAVARLANLLTEAAGAATGERDDDRR